MRVQSAISGYPKGAVIASGTTAALWWLSTVDNNLSDPDTKLLDMPCDSC
jgi:hypothetical protein